MFFVIHVEGDLPFIAINNGTCGVKKRSTKNNGHAPILGHVYWIYALKAIIKCVIIYIFLFIINVYILLCYNCYDPDYEIQKKTHMHVWKCKLQEFLVFPLRPAHVFTNDYVFLIMDIVPITRMSEAM